MALVLIVRDETNMIDMKTMMGWSLMAIMVIFISACDENDGSNLSSRDKTFLKKAALANRAEIELGELASDEATHEGVQHFGSHMVSEHTTALNELEELADDEDINLPNGLDNEHEEKKEYLMTLSGYQFDTAYVNSQVKDHQLVAAMFEEAKDNSDDEEVREYATKYLPHIEEHLTTALSLQDVLLAAKEKRSN